MKNDDTIDVDSNLNLRLCQLCQIILNYYHYCKIQNYNNKFVIGEAHIFWTVLETAQHIS